MVFVTFTTFKRSSQSTSCFSSEPVSQNVVKKASNWSRCVSSWLLFVRTCSSSCKPPTNIVVEGKSNIGNDLKCLLHALQLRLAKRHPIQA